MTKNKDYSIEKKQFRDQLSHHDPLVTDNFFQYCLKKLKNLNKKTEKHTLRSCFCLNNLYNNLAKDLNIESYINYPITAKNFIIWDEGKTPTSPVNLLIVIWTITVNEILRWTKSDNIPDASNIASKIKGVIITFTKVYPRKNVSQEIGKLNHGITWSS